MRGFFRCGLLGRGQAPPLQISAREGRVVEDIRAAITYAADTLAHEETVILEAPAKP